MSRRLSSGFRLLMVDDCREDTFFVQHALTKSGVGDYFFGVPGAQDAMAYLRGEGEFSDRFKFPFPNALLVDLKMPGMDGFDLLRWLQAHPECRVIPTIMFSSSFLESDVHQCYVLGANAFVAKPISFEALVQSICSAYDFWSRCEVPPPPKGERCG